MNDSRFPWLILVPKRAEIREFHDLNEDDQLLLWQEIRLANRALHGTTGAAKMNVGALGNLVPQLHVHIIARFEHDAAWPDPVWGYGQAQPHTDNEIRTIAEKYLAAFQEFKCG